MYLLQTYLFHYSYSPFNALFYCDAFVFFPCVKNSTQMRPHTDSWCMCCTTLSSCVTYVKRSFWQFKLMFCDDVGAFELYMVQVAVPFYFIFVSWLLILATRLPKKDHIYFIFVSMCAKPHYWKVLVMTDFPVFYSPGTCIIDFCHTHKSLYFVHTHLRQSGISGLPWVLSRIINEPVLVIDSSFSIH